MSTSNPTFCRAVAEALGKTYDADGFFTWIVETKLGPARVAVTLDDDIHVTFLRSAFSEAEQALADSLGIDTSKAIAWNIRRRLGLTMDISMIQRMTSRLESVGWEKPVKEVSDPVREALVKAVESLLPMADASILRLPGYDATMESARSALKLAKGDPVLEDPEAPSTESVTFTAGEADVLSRIVAEALEIPRVKELAWDDGDGESAMIKLGNPHHF